MNSPEIQLLIQHLSKLPGLGPRSGRRVALHLLKKREKIFRPLIQVMAEAEQKVRTCHICHALDASDPCTLCTDPKRDPHQLCVVEDVADLWALERANTYRGVYHVLGGVLSAIDGIGPQQLTIQSLLDRVAKGSVHEVILALNATVDGQTTIHYLIEQLREHKIKITTLAHGVPIGGELDYLDEGTLFTAFQARRSAE
ncbi:recombination mediator RecR [Candidatus Odyssella thessalonicensis]|nr:recombination mediator RecR [Candidatus Odyssella thessalonicensis]